jgi:hypothetical protein
MKIEFTYLIDGKPHDFVFEFSSETNWQIKIDNDVAMQKLGE